MIFKTRLACAFGGMLSGMVMMAGIIKPITWIPIVMSLIVFGIVVVNAIIGDDDERELKS